LPVTNLNSLNEFQGLDVDGLKIDAQGLELEILKGADTLLDSIIYAETESGFTPNYINESTQSQVDEYMRSKGFLLFDLIVSRMTYDNLFKDTNNDHGQLLWSESVWLRDYISLHKKNKLSPDKAFNREKALKILAICALQQCIDYGLELAKIFHELGLINLTELKALENQNAWRLTSSDKDNEERKQKSSNRAINFLLRLLPGSTRKLIAKEAHISVQDKHILKSF